MNRTHGRSLFACLALAAASAASAADAPPDWTLANDAAQAKSSEALAQLRAQVLLDRAHFSPGEIDARKGSNVKRALTAFQSAHGLEASGTLDDATWAALDTESLPALVEYTIVDADVAGPFVEIPSDMMEKAALERMGYASAIEALGEKFHASPKLLEQLNPGAGFSAGSTILVPNVADTPALAAAASVVVDKSDSTVSLRDADGKVYAMFPATTGSEHDPLPIGEWKIQGVAKDPVFHYNPELFWDADESHAKAKIAPGPNNPVGIAWVDLSKPHYGIHGTPEPATVAKTQSHGCIRLTNWSVAMVAEAVKPGTPALLQE